MHATTQLVAQAERAGTPMWWLARWHLLSLDAPTVAATWTWAVARACGMHLPRASLLAMGIAVWLLYAADRLLDARVLDGPARECLSEELEARHFFHYRYRRRFAVGIGLAAVGLAVLLPSLAPAAMRLYAIEAAFLFAWFLVLHAGKLQTVASRHRLPKEIAVGLFFAAAVFIPTVAREPGLRVRLLPAAGLLATACSLNCLAIYSWEHECWVYEPFEQTARKHDPGRSGWGEGPDPFRCHWTTRVALRHLVGLAAGLAAVGLGLAMVDCLLWGRQVWTLPAACALSACLLLLLHRSRRRIDPTALRAAADVALLTPLLFLPLLVR